jgi:hypothetical protein
LVLRFEWLTRLPIWRIFPVNSQRHAMAVVPVLSRASGAARRRI